MRQATPKIPIVMATGADPVGFGLVQSLSRPGGNITGLTNFAEELASKQLDLIRELLPALPVWVSSCTSRTRCTCLNGKKRGLPRSTPRLRLCALTITPLKISNGAFAYFAEQKVEAILVPPDVTFNASRTRIIHQSS
jgi:putative ABC transport system substrate-binding protein